MRIHWQPLLTLCMAACTNGYGSTEDDAVAGNDGGGGETGGTATSSFGGDTGGVGPETGSSLRN